MANKIINQEGTMCDAEGCEKFFFGERPKSWKFVTMKDAVPGLGTANETEFDACSVRHAKEIVETFVTIS